MRLLDQLKEIYTVNNQLVLFGEAKNAGLIALNIAIVVGMSSLYNNTTNVWWELAISYVVLFNIISAVIVLSALAAQKLPKELDSTAATNDNYLFFGTVSHLSAEGLVEKLTEKYGLESENSKLELDYARQAVIITQIAARKFARFNYALGFTMASAITPIGYLLYWRFFHPNRKQRLRGGR